MNQEGICSLFAHSARRHVKGAFGALQQVCLQQYRAQVPET